MNSPERLDPQLLELLSAYLDGRLEGAERTALEARLNNEENLRRQLVELRSVRDSLRALPLLTPPRSFALTPAMAGKAAGKPAVFTPRRMAFGSALASLAFVCVLSLEVLSRGVFLPAASAPRALSVNESLAGPRPSETETGAGKSAAVAATSAPAATELPPSAATAQAVTGSGNSVPTETPTEAPVTPLMLGGGCGECSPTETPTIEPSPTATFNFPECGCHPTKVQPAILASTAVVSPSRSSQQSIRVDVQTATPFVEAFFGLAAVLLAAAAALTAVFSRRRH